MAIVARANEAHADAVAAVLKTAYINDEQYWEGRGKSKPHISAIADVAYCALVAVGSRLDSFVEPEEMTTQGLLEAIARHDPDIKKIVVVEEERPE